MDSFYQNTAIDEPVFGNIENGVPKVNVSPKLKPVTPQENFEARKKCKLYFVSLFYFLLITCLEKRFVAQNI